MKKNCLVAFLLTVLLMPLFAGKGNSAFCKKHCSAVASCISPNTHFNKRLSGQDAVIEAGYCCHSAAVKPCTGIHPFSHFNGPHPSLVNGALLPVASPECENSVLLQKKYLFYIYPSHHFW